MLKKILNLKGAQEMSKKEQQSISGGHNCLNGCNTHLPGCKCVNGVCIGMGAYCHP